MNKIKNLKTGKSLILEDKDGDKCIVTPIKYGNAYFCSYRKETIEEAEKSLAVNYMTVEQIEKYKQIGFYTPKYERFKAGDKVLVLPNAEEMCKRVDLDWNDSKENMLGQVCEIIGSDGADYKVHPPDKSDYWYFPQEALAYPYEEETEDKMEEAMQLLKEKGYKIVKE